MRLKTRTASSGFSFAFGFKRSSRKICVYSPLLNALLVSRNRARNAFSSTP